MLKQLQNTPLASRAWRLCNLYTIRDAHGDLVAFSPNEAQREFYNRMWFCNHILKARKLGFSTFIEVIFADDLLFQAGLGVGIIDYTIEDAEAKLAMLRLAWEHLDNGTLHPDTWRYGEILKKAVPLTLGSTRKLMFGNGSSAKCSTSLRGATPQRVHISELGKTAIWAPIKAREIVNGAFNAMTPGNVRNIESTHEGGKLGEHYRLLNTAMRNDDANLSTIQSRFHFFPWWKDPRYVLQTGSHALRPEMVEYFERLRKESGIELSPAQKLWYDHKHLEQGHGMKKEFPGVPGEAFEAIAEGAIYGTLMANARAKGRILDFGHHANLPFHTFWDIGISDYTAVWLVQPVPVHGYLVLDWFEAEGLPGSAMPDRMKLWEAEYNKPIAMHFLPHDAETRAPGDGLSYVATLAAGGLRNVRVVPRTPDKWLGIGYVRDVLPHCWFNKATCDVSRNRDGTQHAADDTQEDFPSGVACLEGYSKDTSPGTMNLREMPKHDLFSHSCDAFRTFGEAKARGMLDFAEAGEKPKAVGGLRGKR
jgi:hypothetical protein